MKPRASRKTTKEKIHKISPKRLLLFRIAAMVIIPAVFLVFVEVGLRIAGFGYPTSAIIKTKIENREIYCHNYKFGWRFFPPEIAREFSGFVFEKIKSPKTYRIFVLGASAAAGVPDPIYNFGRFLEIMLEDKYPKTKFEVVTAAMPAINSHAVLPIVRDCAKYQPDLFIVYLGNNEVVGPFGAGTVFTPLARNLSFIRANVAVKTTKTGQLLESLSSALGSAKNKSRNWGGLEMFLDKQVRYDSPDLKYVYSHYEKNLKDICKAGTKSGGKVIVSNVVSNLKDNPPFASLHREDITATERQKWQWIYDQGIKYETAGHYEEAIEHYLEAEMIDETFADLQFRMGKCLWNTGQYKKAKQRYIKARNFDTVRLCADTTINSIVRSVAENKENEGIYFVDSIKTLEENSPENTTGKEIFHEHVHFKFDGNYMLAKSILGQVDRILPEKILKQKKRGPFLTLSQCKDRLVYTEFEDLYTQRNVLNHYIKKPPFTNQLYHHEHEKELTQEIEKLTLCNQDVYLKATAIKYEQKTAQYPEDWMLYWKSGEFFSEELKDLNNAIKNYEKVVEQLPFGKAYYKLMHIYALQDNYDTAKKYSLMLANLKPRSAELMSEIGKICHRNEDYKSAIKYYRRVIEINPLDYFNAYLFLADSYNKLGKKKIALKIIRKSLESFPKDTPCDNLVLFPLLMELGQTKLAIDHYKEVLEVKPDLLPILNNLSWILAAYESAEIRDPANAIKYAKRAAELTGHKQAEILDTLAVAYAANSNFRMAATTAQKAATLATQDGNNALAQRIQKRLQLYQSGTMYFDAGLK